MQSSKTHLMLVLAACLAAAVLAEIGLRIGHVSFDGSFYTAHSERGWVLRPGSRGWESSEGQEYIRINSDGLHDREHSLPKPASTYRIAVLGNSWTEAMQVPIHKNFCAVLEHELAHCLGHPVEVINFGVSGYSTAQELITLREQVWKYHPDLILLAFYTAKDVFNNSRVFNNAANPEQSPYYVYTRDRLVLDDSFRKLPNVQRTNIWVQNIRGELGNRFRLFQLTNKLLQKVRESTARRALGSQTGELGIKDLDDTIYSPPTIPTLQDAWRVTEGMLRMMRDEVRAHGAQIRLVTLANRPQVDPDPNRRKNFMQHLGIHDMLYPDLRIRSFAEQENIPVTALAIPMSNYAAIHKVYLNGFQNTGAGQGHWNELGHKLAGQVIAVEVCDAISGRPASEISIATSR